MEGGAVSLSNDGLVQPRVVRTTVAQKGCRAMIWDYMAMAAEREEDAAHDSTGWRWFCGVVAQMLVVQR